MSEFKGLIFDLDGVLVDTEYLHVSAEREVCRFFGMDVPPGEWRSLKGRSLRENFAGLRRQYGDESFAVDDMVDLKNQIYPEMLRDQVLLMPGAEAFLKRSRRHYQHLGLATSSYRIYLEVLEERFQLLSYFDAVVTGEDVIRGKPDPEHYQKVLDLLGLSGPEVLAVEDSDNGIRSAKGAGCVVAAFTSTCPHNELFRAGADFTFDRFSDLDEVVFSA